MLIYWNLHVRKIGQLICTKRVKVLIFCCAMMFHARMYAVKTFSSHPYQYLGHLENSFKNISVVIYVHILVLSIEWCTLLHVCTCTKRSSKIWDHASRKFLKRHINMCATFTLYDLHSANVKLLFISIWGQLKAVLLFSVYPSTTADKNQIV